MSRGLMIAMTAAVAFGAAIPMYLTLRTANGDAITVGGQLFGVFLALWCMSWVPAWIVLAIMRGRTTRSTLFVASAAASLFLSGLVWLDRMQ